MTQRTLILPLLLSYLRIGCFLLLFMVSFLCFFSCFPPTFSLYSLFPLFTLLSTRFFFVLSLSYLSVTFFYNFPPLRPLSSSPCCISWLLLCFSFSPYIFVPVFIIFFLFPLFLCSSASSFSPSVSCTSRYFFPLSVFSLFRSILLRVQGVRTLFTASSESVCPSLPSVSNWSINTGPLRFLRFRLAHFQLKPTPLCEWPLSIHLSNSIWSSCLSFEQNQLCVYVIFYLVISLRLLFPSLSPLSSTSRVTTALVWYKVRLFVSRKAF